MAVSPHGAEYPTARPHTAGSARLPVQTLGR